MIAYLSTLLWLNPIRPKNIIRNTNNQTSELKFEVPKMPKVKVLLRSAY